MTCGHESGSGTSTSSTENGSSTEIREKLERPSVDISSMHG